MDDNNSAFAPYDEDPFENPLIDNLIEVDPALVLPNVGPYNAQPQQQNDHVVQHDNIPFFMELTIQDQFMHSNNNNNFPNGGGIGNFEANPSRMRGRDPTIQEDQDKSMNDNNNNNNNIFNEGGIGNFEIGGTSNQIQHTNENMGPQNYQGVISFPYWPPIPRPLICSCCQVLRQIIHTNGFDFEKLEIHGMIGVISHAIIQKRNITPDGPSNGTYQKIDFCYKSAEQIKSFLVKYCAQQIASGYIIVEDPMSAYYEALCTGMDWTKDFTEEDNDLIPPNEPEPEPVPEPENGRRTRPRRNRGEQIKRIKLMTLDDLKDMFHMTLENAAKQLDVSDTCVKNICRRAKLERWPQRKVNGNARQVRVLRRALDSTDPGVRARTRVVIQRLQEEIIEVCAGIVPTGIEMVQF